MPLLVFILFMLLLPVPFAPLAAQSKAAGAAEGCGEVVTVKTHGRTATRYALAHPEAAAPTGKRIALVLLVGGGGHLNLDDRGCPRSLKGNSLVRSLPHFHREGFATALVDAPSDHPGSDGLAGFRISSQHAKDIGVVIEDVRRRIDGPVWLVGTSRGTISGANAAARLSGAAAPDGLVLTSPITSGGKGVRRPWAAQTVFQLPLQSIRMPVLVIGHAADKCIRTPPSLVGRIVAQTKSAREQAIVVTGGNGPTRGQSGLEACQGRTPHGFLGVESAVAAGIARFIRGEKY